MKITQADMEKYLTEAKNSHTYLHGNNPDHPWVHFYAEYILNQLKEHNQVHITFSVSGKTMTLDEIFTQEEERKARETGKLITVPKEG